MQLYNRTRTEPRLMSSAANRLITCYISKRFRSASPANPTKPLCHSPALYICRPVSERCRYYSAFTVTSRVAGTAPSASVPVALSKGAPPRARCPRRRRREITNACRSQTWARDADLAPRVGFLCRSRVWILRSVEAGELVQEMEEGFWG